MMIGTTKDIKTICMAFIIGIALAVVCALFARSYITAHAMSIDGELSTRTDATVDVASSTDVDDSPYLTYQGVDGQPLQTNQILLSIRNVLIIFLGFQILIWVHSRMTVIVKRLHSKKRGD